MPINQPVNRYTKIAFDRVIIFEPFIDPVTSWHIWALQVMVRFEHAFACNSQNPEKEPAGAEALNKLLRVGIDTERGELTFHPAPTLECTWEIVEYSYTEHTTTATPMSAQLIDKTTFERLLSENKHLAHPDRSLQSTCYALSPTTTSP